MIFGGSWTEDVGPGLDFAVAGHAVEGVQVVVAHGCFRLIDMVSLRVLLVSDLRRFKMVD